MLSNLPLLVPGLCTVNGTSLSPRAREFAPPHPQATTRPSSQGYLPLSTPGSLRQAGSQPAQLLNALAAQDKDSLLWILSGLAQRRPELGLRWGSIDLQKSTHYAGVELQPYSRSPHPAISAPIPDDDVTSIQFIHSEFHVMVAEETLAIEVTRTGNKNGRSEVQFESRDLTAKAGEHYEELEGTLVFEPGCGSCIIHVDLCGLDTWEAVLDFTVELKRDTCIGAKVGRQLSTARVKIVGTETFPSPDLSEEFENDPTLESNALKATVYIAFLQFLWSMPQIRCATIKRCLKDQLHNVHFVITQFITLFTINILFKDGAGSISHSQYFHAFTTTEWLILIVFVQIIMMFVLHVMDYWALSWRVGGPARQLIQQALLRRFLYYDTASHSEITATALSTTIANDAVSMVSGYKQAMNIVEALGGVASILVFKLTSPLIFHEQQQVRAIEFLPFILYPVLLGLFMQWRAELTTRCLEDHEECHDGVLSYISQAVDCFNLITDYKRRQAYVDGFETFISRWNASNRASNETMTNNNYFPIWLTTSLIAFWYLYFGQEVIKGNLQLGFFIADLKLLDKFGQEFEKLYVLMMSIEEIFPDIQQVVTLLNKPTDLADRLRKERYIIAKTDALRSSLQAHHVAAALDHEPIIVQDLKLAIGSKDFVYQGKMEIEQGKMTCMIGKHGNGTSSLIKVIGGAIFPLMKAGEVFVSAHLRVLHVCQAPLFFQTTVLENLTFGCEAKGDARKERITKILARLGLHNIIKLLDSDDTREWQGALRLSEKYLLHFARAIVANPYVLCLHKPTMPFGDATAKVVRDLLREFVDRRGIEQNDSKQAHRRPRTVVYSTLSLRSAQEADAVYFVSETQLLLVKASELTQSLFD